MVAPQENVQAVAWDKDSAAQASHWKMFHRDETINCP